MELERIQYRIYKLLPVIILAVVIILIIVLLSIRQSQESRDRPSDLDGQSSITATTSPFSDTLITNKTELLEYLSTNCILVEVSYTDNWSSSHKYERYYDYLTGNYRLYKVTLDSEDKQYIQIEEQHEFNAETKAVTNVPTTLPTDYSDLKLSMLDKGLYSINGLSAGYQWLARLKSEGKTLTVVKIIANCLDVYYLDNGVPKRAVITDRYILTDDYTGVVPTY